MIPAVSEVGQPSGADFTQAGAATGTKRRKAATTAFHEVFGSPAGWERAPLNTQLAAQDRCGRFVVWLILTGQVRPSAGYLLACHGRLAPIGDRVHTQLSADFQSTGEQLGYPGVIARRQWSALLLIGALAQVAPGRLTPQHISTALEQLHAAAADLGQPGIRNLSNSTYGMQAVLFHLGLITSLPPRGIRASRKHKTWHDIAAQAPAVRATCQDYLDQMSVRLRPNC